MIKNACIPNHRERIFYTCGPTGMVEAMFKLLKDLGLHEDQIKEGNFPGY